MSPQRIAWEYGSGGAARPSGSRWVRSIGSSWASGSDRIRKCELEPARGAEAGRAALDRTRQAKGGLLVERPRDDLHAPGEAGRAEAGRDGDRREPGQVEGGGRPDERLDHRLDRSAELVLELVAALCCGRNRRGKERV